MARRKGPSVRVQTHTDDYAHEVFFDASPWFSDASDEEIMDLAAIDWGGDYAADYVAEYMENKVLALKKMFKYLRSPATREQRDPPGFEVYVNSEDAMAWIAKNRPHLIYEGELKPYPPGPFDWWPQK